ncbi:arsenical pump-driving ATPase, putative [Eimeria acervulina]|uniref:Arsenical pump-driving ATPase, putative n=1 Tax=Eimeria acervulina TaxID=5801 RepID=U6GG33_EIMAC|nr:arsenical pump-driving ATPase, putative [Eimeria acervulina]CDI77534.1 arsenical pump-driving ATPase, putative [Eimeria acervulina]
MGLRDGRRRVPPRGESTRVNRNPFFEMDLRWGKGRRWEDNNKLRHCNQVLLLSTDPAHNLSDALTQKFSSTPSLVNGYKNLYAMEIDSRAEETAGFKSAGDKDTKDLMQFLPELINAVPGIDEALSFAELMQSVQTMRYSTIVFDTAPTGHTLRLLGFPAVIEKGLKKIGDISEGFAAALDIFSSLSSGQHANPQETHTTFVCVCIPEFLSLFETERLIQQLAKQKIDCSNIVVNQVLMPIGLNAWNCDEEGYPCVSPSLAAALEQQQSQPLSTKLLLQPAAARRPEETSEEEAARLREFVLQLQHRLV